MATNGTPVTPEKHGPAAFSIVNTISIMIVVGYIAAVPLWMWYPPTGVPPETLAIINQMMGAFGMAFATIINFHVGSSRGSKDKDDAQNEALKTLSSGPPAAVQAAAEAAAPVAAAAAAPPAAAVAAPPAVDKALDERGIPHEPKVP